MSFTSIPSFSLESIKRSDLKTIKDLTVALSTHGFFTITEHGISDEILTSSYAKSKQFIPWVSMGNSVLRLIHYPPVQDQSNSLRARAHEDINLITLLVGAEESGLEVQNTQGEWIPIEAESKSIVCNIGDMMQLVTRNKLKSTTHRVVDYNLGEPKSRYSMPFFLHPSPNIELCSIVDESPESISAHDFLEERLKAIKLY